MAEIIINTSSEWQVEKVYVLSGQPYTLLGQVIVNTSPAWIKVYEFNENKIVKENIIGITSEHGICDISRTIQTTKNTNCLVFRSLGVSVLSLILQGDSYAVRKNNPIPEYIEIRTAAGQPAAYLSPASDGLKDCYSAARLNGESLLTFLLPMTSPKWEEITPECRIIAGAREYTILHDQAIDIERDQSGKLWGKVMAQESWKLLQKQYLDNGINNIPDETATALDVVILSGGTPYPGYQAGSAGSVLSYLLEGSGWALDVCDVEGTHDLETEKESLLVNIQKVQEIWGGYLVWDSINKKVSLRSEILWQNYTGFQIRYRKNLKHITRTANHDIVTRLYPFGENDLDISSVNNEVKYIENFSYTPNIYRGVYQNQEIADPQELKDKAAEELAKICKPRYTYKTGMVDLRTLPEYNHEDFSLGDMVDTIDENLGFNVRNRIIWHKYNLFQPWKCEIETGDFQERFVAKLADSLNVAKFVSEALKPNPATSNMLKGFINTFATQINSANGKLVWNDSTLEAIEIDETGQETGKRVRITPGGVGISTDGGQTFVTAMTGSGILANTIIVNALYALSTDDGYTKLEASGLHVYDQNQIERLIAGWWMDGFTKRFGLKIKSSSGTTMLDDRGLLQTWQNGYADNVDSLHPFVIKFYIPPETLSIKQAKLSFTLEKFRAYEKGALAGGSSTLTSKDGGSSTQTSSSGGGTTATSGWNSADPTYGFNNRKTSSGGDPSHTHNFEDKSVSSIDHTHDITIGDHSHSVSIPNHRHDVDIPSHEHGLDFGIYESTAATGVGVKINGIDRTEVLGGPFYAEKENLDITNYIVSGQWNKVELSSTQLGRINASYFIQCFIQS